MYPYRIFTLEQANRTLPEVAKITRSTQARLDALRSEYRRSDSEKDAELEQETRSALNAWTQAILELGAQPKGVFTVDFRSPDPNMLWCWTPDETRISHRHFTWESFKDRVPVDVDESGWLSWN